MDNLHNISCYRQKDNINEILYFSLNPENRISDFCLNRLILSLNMCLLAEVKVNEIKTFESSKLQGIEK